VELLSFENEKDCWDLDEDEKLAVAAAKKEDGNAKFKAGDIARAVRRYEAAKACLASDYKMDEKQKEACKAAKVVLCTNLAMCAAKLGKQEDVLKHAEEALKLDEKCFKVPRAPARPMRSLATVWGPPTCSRLPLAENGRSTQALHRRGGIRLRANDFDGAEADLTQASETFLCLIAPLCSYLYGGLYGGLYERAHIIRYFPHAQALEFGAASEAFCKGVRKELALCPRPPGAVKRQ
jgi:tetratricopeptide (TPR) repeat protein